MVLSFAVDNTFCIVDFDAGDCALTMFCITWAFFSAVPKNETKCYLFFFVSSLQFLLSFSYPLLLYFPLFIFPLFIFPLAFSFPLPYPFFRHFFFLVFSPFFLSSFTLLHMVPTLHRIRDVKSHLEKIINPLFQF